MADMRTSYGGEFSNPYQPTAERYASPAVTLYEDAAGRMMVPSMRPVISASPVVIAAATVNAEPYDKKAIRMIRARLWVTCVASLVGFGLIASRLIGATLSDMEQAQNDRPVRYSTAAVSIPFAGRGNILDRTGIILASNLSAASLYANPRQMLDPKDAARKLVNILPDLGEAELAARLSADRSFVWVRRHLTRKQQYAINRLGIPGVYFREEEKRVYPHGALFSHNLGFTDIDQRGLAGIEKSFETLLSDGSGRPVTLSMDIRLQHILREELLAAYTEFRATAAVGIVMNVKNGEILAMVSLPDFDPNQPANAPAESRFNRASLAIYEMGSTFKIFNTAMALASGAVKLGDRFDVSQPIRIGGFAIRDFDRHGKELTAAEIFIHSSNIGSVKMASLAGWETQQKFLDSLGLLRPLSFDLPETGRPLYPHTWRPINGMTISYGHGIAVSPLQLLAAVSSIVNDGIYYAPTLIRQPPEEERQGTRVLDAETSVIMRQLMRRVVSEGTGKKANVPGYLVGGKTGTADKPGVAGYREDARASSFVGAFPMNDPRYSFLILIDEPKPEQEQRGAATGGQVAAPVAARIVERMAPLLGLYPQVAVEQAYDGQFPEPEGVH